MKKNILFSGLLLISTIVWAQTDDKKSTFEKIVKISSGGDHNCALFEEGRVKCWGRNHYGQLGLGDRLNRGDQPGELGKTLPYIDLGTNKKAIDLTAGDDFNCVILDDKSVKCWGDNQFGQLGLGDKLDRGDHPNEMGDNLPTINLGLGRKAVSIAAEISSVCALLDNGAMKCWGRNGGGQLGLGDTRHRGGEPGQMGDFLSALDFGTQEKITQISASCVLFENNKVKCWGRNNVGQIGLGDTEARGDEPREMGIHLPPLDLGTRIPVLSLSRGNRCSILIDNSLKCWGYNFAGQLGLGDEQHRGDNPNEMGNRLPFVELGINKKVQSVGGGNSFNCALLDDESIKCWGNNGQGQLGLGDTRRRGNRPNEMGDNLPALNLGLPVKQMSIGDSHGCALLSNNAIKCWGHNFYGQLGLGDQEYRGDEPNEMGNELPAVNLSF